MDPPRKGCDVVCLDTFVKMSSKWVIYVSCDSATMTRDMRYRAESEYEAVKVRGCDVFSHLGYVESVVLLQKIVK